MSRATWTGSIAFELVNVSVILYPAEKRSEMEFRLLDGRGQSPIRC